MRILGLHPISAYAVSFILLIGASWARADDIVGTVTHLAGLLSLTRPDGETRLLGVQSQVGKGDALTTETNSYARIKFVDESELVLRPNSRVQIDDFNFVPDSPENDKVVVSMLKGGLRAVTGLIGKRNPDKVRFGTPTATIGIRGTHFGALLCRNDCDVLQTVRGALLANGLHVDVAEGSIALSNSAGVVVLTAGQFGFVRDPSTLPSIVPQDTGIRIVVPPSISRNNAGGRSVSEGLAADCVAQ